MDSNPPDHFQMPASTINLKSSDGKIFQVEVKVAKLSLLFKEMLDDLGVDENEFISIPHNGPKISGDILGKIINWADHHKDDPAVAEDDEKEEKPTRDISSWDSEFLQVDLTTLFQIIQAANFLDIKVLLDVSCKAVAKMIKRMTLNEVRQTIYIQNDFSPEEEHLVYRESKWCEVFDLYDRGLSWSTDSVQNVSYEENHVIEGSLSNSQPHDKIIERGNATLPVPPPDRAANVEELSLSFRNFSMESVQFFAELFPSVEKLDVEAAGGEEIPSLSIGKHWRGLKHLEINGEVVPW